MERNTKPTAWHREMRGALIDRGYALDANSDGALSMCSAEVERLRGALHKIASGYPCQDALAMMRVASDALGITDEQSKDASK